MCFFRLRILCNSFEINFVDRDSGFFSFHFACHCYYLCVFTLGSIEIVVWVPFMWDQRRRSGEKKMLIIMHWASQFGLHSILTDFLYKWNPNWWSSFSWKRKKGVFIKIPWINFVYHFILAQFNLLCVFFVDRNRFAK